MAISTNLIKSFQLSALTTALALAGCGGGGGNDTLPPPVKGGGTTDSTGSTPTSAIKISAISLIDVNGKTTMTVNSSGVNAKLTVTDASGKAVSGAMVTFIATGGVTFGTSNGAVLTNANGEASISVKPTNTTDTGAYSISATAVYNDTTATTSASNFSLQPANISLSSLTASNTSLSSGGTTNITLVTLDANTNTVLNDIVVNFSTTCGTFTNNSVSSSNQGNITTTYKAINTDGKLCEGTQTITATSTTGGVSKSVNVNIAAIQASSIIYTTSNEVKLGASNSGSSSTGQVEFTVYSNGIPAANQDVIITKNYAPLDFSFVKLGNQSAQTVKSDSNGNVNVTLYPGALPGPVELKATLATNSTITALSKDVAVATGRATQNGMSVSLTKNTLAVGVDGDTTEVTVRLVDRVGNAVPDGTVVSFVSEGGKITPNCSTVDGACSATFTTQNPRSDGRLSVVAYVEGDKSYIDTNGNNKFDIGEPLIHNIGSFYRDDNENGAHDLGEYVYVRPITGSPLACGTSSFGQPNLVTQILSVNPLSTVTHQCDNQLEAILRYQFVLGLAGNVPVFVPPFTTLSPNTDKDTAMTKSFKMYGNGAQTVSMPAGTTISISTKDNTSYSPTATLVDVKQGDIVVDKNLFITKAEPNSRVKVDLGTEILTLQVDAQGTASRNSVGANITSASVIDADLSCSAELISGNLTVPALVDLSNKTVNDADVSYTLSYKNCRPSDEIRITTVAPAPSANTVTKTIYVK
ncbi:hypothetical protein I6I87_04265 [Moraxella osloensis]|nr:hypothetical protein [Moraxella osloensis]QQU07273.1 hypothetical protein I6I87_04265 [Moraxella osloensis]